MNLILCYGTRITENEYISSQAGSIHIDIKAPQVILLKYLPLNNLMG